MIEIRHKPIHDGQRIQDAYDELYEQRSLRMRDSFYLWLLELLDPKPGEVLLEVACGNGRLVQLAAESGATGFGLEISFGAIAEAAQSGGGAGWLIADGHAIPVGDASVDALFSIGSLEHYDNPLQGARELARVLKPSGRACILLPNTFGLFGNILHVWRTGEVFDDGQPRQRYATRATWEAILNAAGLQCDRLVGWGESNWPRTVADALFLATHPQKILRSSLATLAPVNLANHLVFVCRCAEKPRDSFVPTFPI